MDHARLLLAWNEAVNLTALRLPAQVALEHVADSLTALPELRSFATPAGRSLALLDLGSGGGYPGLPLAAAGPVRRVALVEATVKKARFLAVAGAAVTRALAAAGDEGLAVTALPRRAEALATEPGEREAWDVVVVRAVGPLAELVELALPLLRVGGHLVAWKRDAGDGALEQELATAKGALQALGAAPEPTLRSVAVPGLTDHRLVIVEKRASTPARFPRHPAERRRRLLG